MAQRLIAPLAPRIQLFAGYTVILAALDPTTGADVGGVKVSNVAMQVDVEEDAEEPQTFAVLPPLLAFGPEAV